MWLYISGAMNGVRNKGIGVMVLAARKQASIEVPETEIPNPPRYVREMLRVCGKCKTNILKLQNIPPGCSEAQAIRQDIEKAIPRGIYVKTCNGKPYVVTGLIYALDLPMACAVKVVCEPVDAGEPVIPEYVSAVEFLGPCNCRGQECSPRFWRIGESKEQPVAKVSTSQALL